MIKSGNYTNGTETLGEESQDAYSALYAEKEKGPDTIRARHPGAMDAPSAGETSMIMNQKHEASTARNIPEKVHGEAGVVREPEKPTDLERTIAELEKRERGEPASSDGGKAKVKPEIPRITQVGHLSLPHKMLYDMSNYEGFTVAARIWFRVASMTFNLTKPSFFKGVPLSLPYLAEEFGVSTTAINNAFKQLEREGKLVRVSTGSGGKSNLYRLNPTVEHLRSMKGALNEETSKTEAIQDLQPQVTPLQPQVTPLQPQVTPLQPQVTETCNHRLQGLQPQVTQYNNTITNAAARCARVRYEEESVDQEAAAEETRGQAADAATAASDQLFLITSTSKPVGEVSRYSKGEIIFPPWEYPVQESCTEGPSSAGMDLETAFLCLEEEFREKIEQMAVRESEEIGKLIREHRGYPPDSWRDEALSWEIDIRIDVFQEEAEQESKRYNDYLRSLLPREEDAWEENSLEDFMERYVCHVRTSIPPIEIPSSGGCGHPPSDEREIVLSSTGDPEMSGEESGELGESGEIVGLSDNRQEDSAACGMTPEEYGAKLAAVRDMYVMSSVNPDQPLFTNTGRDFLFEGMDDEKPGKRSGRFYSVHRWSRAYRRRFDDKFRLSSREDILAIWETTWKEFRLAGFPKYQKVRAGIEKAVENAQQLEGGITSLECHLILRLFIEYKVMIDTMGRADAGYTSYGKSGNVLALLPTKLDEFLLDLRTGIRTNLIYNVLYKDATASFGGGLPLVELERPDLAAEMEEEISGLAAGIRGCSPHADDSNEPAGSDSEPPFAACGIP